MKKFKFRLEKIKEFREDQAKEAKQELARRNATLANAENILMQLITERERSKLSSDSILTAAELSLLGEYEGLIQSLIQDQRKVVEDAEKQVEIARLDLLEKAKSEKALSLLRDKRFEDYTEELKRQDKKEITSLALRQHLMRQGVDTDK
jgi:flagellar FliJ protein